MGKDVLDYSCLRLSEMIAAGQLKSREAVDAVFGSIEERDPAVGAFLSVCRERAEEKAKVIDAKIASGRPVGPLAGLPVALKDNMCTSWGRTTCGSRILEHFHAPYTATAVRKLEQAGAIIIGKTNMDEFAMGSSTENSSLRKTVNPWCEERVPGGSSGGAAAAVATGMCFAALGSDTGGSIRQPASFCGVTGLKPTYGRVSRYGLVAFGSSLDQIGPLARSVQDCALMLNAIAGHDPADSTSVSEEMAPVPDYLAGLEKPVENLRIGIAPQFTAGIQPGVQTAVDRALETFRGLGAETVEIELPHMDYAIAAYYVIATGEASSNLARYDGVHYGRRTHDPGDCVEVYTRSRDEGFGKEVKRRIMLGTYALSSGYYDAYYLQALKVRNLIRGDLDAAFKRCDCIVMPVAPTTAFRIGEKTGDPLLMYLTDVFTIPANLAGIPGITIPCGLDLDHLPVGLQILAPAFSEGRLLRVARMFENATDWHTMRPEVNHGT
ncbi:MAG: Asp-tRNA(Asn)/Glu-tRNA(Gln) amidotransferase subunit GatA [Planctomycetota bacterium]